VEHPSYRVLNYREIGGCRVVALPGALDRKTGERLFVELKEACDRIVWDEDARVVVLALDKSLDSLPEIEDFRRDEPESASWAEPLTKLQQPVIGAIGGDALGSGLELALACDIRIGAENARFGFPQIRHGRIPSQGGTQRLPRLIGYSKAMELILTGELLDAREAERTGLLNRVVSPDEVMNEAITLAQDMADKSPLSLIYAKEALHGGCDLTLDQGLRMELDLYLLLFGTSDRTEGIKAFREKRKPRFSGT
jgi:enoyl-CoA hydratase